MEFRIKDLLLTTLDEDDNSGGGGDGFCVTPTGILCCCVGWTANGTTQDKGKGLTESHLAALKGEVRSGSNAEPGDDAALDALEAKLSEALAAVRAQRQANKS